MSHAIYKPEVLTPTLLREIQTHSPKVAADRIADLVIQIQAAAFDKARSDIRRAILTALFAEPLATTQLKAIA